MQSPGVTGEEAEEPAGAGTPAGEVPLVKVPWTLVR